jgi:hypothetical protein
MIPIKDRNPSEITPWGVYFLIGANVACFLFQLSLPEPELRSFLLEYGMVPRRVTAAIHGKTPLLQAAVIPAMASMFLHGGWLHLIGNMWFLRLFGDNIEGRLKLPRFFAFYLLCGLFASSAQYLTNPSSPLPTIGASGAIAGVLGAYIVTWPRARILTLLPVFYFITFVELPAIFVLGFWFILQVFGGVGSLGAQYSHGGVAYVAHVAGFICGAILVKTTPFHIPRNRQYR